MKTQLFLFGAIGAIMALWLGWGLYVIYSTERPPYKVIRNLSATIEVRQYEEQTWISTPMGTDGSSFPVLASYIFGRNREKQQVAMTAPVITDHRMAFILPRGLTAAAAPAPDGQAIDITTVPARKLATLEFSWRTPADRVAAKTAELIEILEAHGIATRGRPFLMRYNDPWTPPFLRRNEVAIEAL